MSGAGKAAAVAVGAAVGAVIGGPAGAVTGASLGSSAAGYASERSASKRQRELDEKALQLNLEQARLQAKERAAIHARNFRQTLASQVALASLRGGTGSLVRQFGMDSYRNFLLDQKAIETGLQITEAQGAIAEANISAQQTTRDMTALTRFANSSFNALNLNLLQKRES